MDRYNNLPLPLKVIFVSFSTMGILLGIFYVFGVNMPWSNAPLMEFTYYFLLIGAFGPLIFILLPAHRKAKKIPWYDLIAACLVFAICMYQASQAVKLTMRGRTTDPLDITMAIILLALIVEAGRRIGGKVYMGVVIIVSLYPLFASSLPSMLWGTNFTFPNLTSILAFSAEGLLGIPTKVMGEILIGFLLFSGVMVASGAGDFFLKVATALLGKYRGGPAKISVLSSGFFGSLSGSVFSNVVATGTFTIPAMKRMGYPPHYAGAVEACASTGGMLMPPVMGATAFIICEMLGITYAQVVVAAVIPAVLYYFGLMMQVDAYAGKVGLQGLPKNEIPRLRATLKEGWPYLTVFFFLLFGLLIMKLERQTPWWAVILMLLLSFLKKETRMTPRRFVNTLVTVGKLITETMSLMLPICLVYGGLTITGTTASLSAGLIALGGSNIFVVLLIGTAACYVMGMAGLCSAAYIFLAVTLAPAALRIFPLNELAVHMFIFYYSMLAMITLPVAGAAFLGAAMAGASPMQTGWTAMRLGIVIYFIPFFFVFNPSLILQGSLIESLYLFILCLIGVVFLAVGCEGYMLGFGKIKKLYRPFYIIGGFLIGFPMWKATIAGVVILSILLAINFLGKAREKRLRITSPT